MINMLFYKVKWLLPNRLTLKFVGNLHMRLPCFVPLLRQIYRLLGLQEPCRQSYVNKGYVTTSCLKERNYRTRPKDFTISLFGNGGELRPDFAQLGLGGILSRLVKERFSKPNHSICDRILLLSSWAPARLFSRARTDDLASCSPRGWEQLAPLVAIGAWQFSKSPAIEPVTYRPA